MVCFHQLLLKQFKFLPKEEQRRYSLKIVSFCLPGEADFGQGSAARGRIKRNLEFGLDLDTVSPDFIREWTEFII